ncbi:hypothetical protein, partial [Paenibacillus apiarius]
MNKKILLLVFTISFVLINTVYIYKYNILSNSQKVIDINYVMGKELNANIGEVIESTKIEQSFLSPKNNL